MSMKTGLSLVLATVALLTVSTSSYAQSRNDNLVDTFWAGTDSDGSPFVFEFQQSGKVKYVPQTGITSRGKWKIGGDLVEIEINRKFVKFSGSVNNGRMEGVASSRAGRKWRWSATRQPVVAASSAPIYPPIAVAARATGYVIVEVQINAEGLVTSARALKGHPLLQRVSVDAAKSWRFAPSAEGNNVRTSQVTFIFNVLDSETKDSKVRSPVFLTPYQAEIKRPQYVLNYSHSTANRK
jgi:TonB family protein